MTDERKSCGHDDHSLCPLSDAFAPHVLVACRNENTLCYARFTGHGDRLLRRETQYRGNAYDFLDKIKEGYWALCRLRAYDIAIPEFTYVVARDVTDGGVSLFTMIECVEGENITDIVPVKQGLAQEVEQIFIGFLHYLEDARSTGEPFWTDFNIHQFMFGMLGGDPLPRPYLVDVEPYSAKWPREGEASSERLLLASRSYIMQLMSVFLCIKGFEEHNNRGIPLKKARMVLLRSLRAVSPAPLYNEFRDDLLSLLGRRGY